ncbi:hypothetical protein MPER_04975 [Moniliophthora perniciosa FA553]|nr:hypothetical protein MPER_04975 [Moniliophthora perniciosa FA553]
MADTAGGDCAALCCGACCLGIFSALAQWCNTPEPYGIRGCGCCDNPKGCCGSCCDRSFNDDNFDEEVKKDMEKTRRKENNEQPSATKDMDAATPMGVS